MKKEKWEHILHDEQGVKDVSEQITDAYNEGTIDKEVRLHDREQRKIDD